MSNWINWRGRERHHRGRAIVILVGAVLAFASCRSFAHEVPSELTVDAFLKPDHQILRLLIRVPLSGLMGIDMELVRVDSLKAIGEIPEKMAPWVQVGQPVELSVDAFPTKKIAGKVSRISPAVNTPTRAFTFEATVPNGEGLLKPGTFARVHLTTALVEPVLTIPYAAMSRRTGTQSTQTES